MVPPSPQRFMTSCDARKSWHFLPYVSPPLLLISWCVRNKTDLPIFYSPVNLIISPSFQCPADCHGVDQVNPAAVCHRGVAAAVPGVAVHRAQRAPAALGLQGQAAVHHPRPAPRDRPRLRALQQGNSVATPALLPLASDGRDSSSCLCSRE